MRRALLAILLAAAVHAALALALAGVLSRRPTPPAPPALDLSCVELSLSEEEAAEAPAHIAPPSVEAPPPALPPVEEISPPDPVARASLETLPPAVAALDLPEPAPEAPVRLDRPPAPPPSAPTETAAASAPSAAAPAPSAPAPQQARVDVLPQPRRTIRPKYPEESRKRSEEGDVLVELDVTERGTVAAVRLVMSSGFSALDAAAQQAVRRATFTPAMTGGRAVPMTTRLTLKFRLKK